MKKEVRTVVYDEDLRLEAYRFEGLLQPFPCHFHDYYVLGLMERGERTLICRGQEYTIGPGDVLLFSLGDSHGCVQREGEGLDYRGLTLSQPVMLALAEEVTGRRELPRFSQNVLRDGEAARRLRSLHRLVLEGSGEFDKEEHLLLLLSHLLRAYGRPFDLPPPAYGEEIRRACALMEENYPRRLTLDQICWAAGVSKATLLRTFPRAKGVTPYRYLENLRVGVARALLEQGVAPAEAALRTGFSDQSHFTNYFGRFIGLSPGAYRDIFLEKEG